MFDYLSFATGNREKFEEAALLLPGLKHVSIDLPEIQELDAQAIVVAKLELVAVQGLSNILVEDVSLHFDGLNGLPGPLIKWFLKALGTAGLYDLVVRTGNMNASVVAKLGFIDANKKITVVEGRVQGTIVPPRGGDGFGWDPIFQPNGESKTYAEMSHEEKSKVSHRALAIEALKKDLA